MRRTEEAVKKGHGNEEREDRVLPDKRQTFPDVMGGAAPGLARDAWDPQAIHHRGHDAKPQASQVEDHGSAGPGHDETCYRRHDGPCPLPDTRVQGHRTTHDSAVDQMRIERL